MNSGLRSRTIAACSIHPFIRMILALLVSVVLLGILVSFVDFEKLVGWGEILEPMWLAPALAFFLTNLGLRGVRLCVMGRSTSESVPCAAWIRLAARHQVLFSFLPSGLGDLGFPALARRTTAISSAAGTRLIGVYRLQDIWALVVLLTIGALGTVLPFSIGIPSILGGLFIAVAALIWSDALTVRLGRSVLSMEDRFPSRIRQFVRERLSTFISDLDQEFQQSTSMRDRLVTAVLTLASWSLAAASLWSLFRMTGFSFDIQQIVLIVGWLNLAGAFATFTFGGLGVAETALAAILIFLGIEPNLAIPVSLIVRPAALVNVMVCGGLIELFCRIQDSGWLSPNRQSEER